MSFESFLTKEPPIAKQLQIKNYALGRCYYSSKHRIGFIFRVVSAKLSMEFLPNIIKFFVFQLTCGEMFVISYGGLRGAVAYAMCQSDKGPNKSLFETVTLIIILLTCFLQGGTIRFIVQGLGFQVGNSSAVVFGCICS
jgi:NhaP-type Na+/H+ or K+/H+ antiporter